MAKCAYCGAEFPDDKFGFKMEVEENGEKKTALFCKDCAVKMRSDFRSKIAQLKKEKV